MSLQAVETVNSKETTQLGNSKFSYNAVFMQPNSNKALIGIDVHVTFHIPDWLIW
ncbi:hypothetical protein cauri_0134 [Corynebacterium aurimucosum ATCC 700975]|uniref:Uncharacterized protein n=1 Tax=Corynebacterium aurimucosum (strain ATCC 700975 / DSM 44827 / CIP 107346 / CN-1) TaxID=548476 RepID=C3PJ75_CORA7|nr:hypothetical protein cauri_0134 [Corynebacterium aurimucosum ATCC 700975]